MSRKPVRVFVALLYGMGSILSLGQYSTQDPHIRAPQTQPAQHSRWPSHIIGSSPALTDVVSLALQVAGSRSLTVLLIGETGTGKELFARGSTRAARGHPSRSWRLTARRYPILCSKASSSGTNLERSRNPGTSNTGCSSWPEPGPYFSTRSRTCRLDCRESFSGFSRNENTGDWPDR